MDYSDVCIIGAGPSGISTALHLSYQGIGSLVLDKSFFPRDKICGDAISGKIPVLVKALDPKIFERFEKNADIHIGTWGIRVVAQNSKMLEFPFFKDYDVDKNSPPGYICKRKEYDNFFVEEAKKRKNIKIFEGIEITKYVLKDNGYLIADSDGRTQISCKVLVIANGANSRFSRVNLGNKLKLKHHAAAVRAYYSGVRGLHENNFVEFFFLDKVVPGYFWIFPVGDGSANIGLGIRSDYVAKKKIKLIDLFFEIIESHPKVKDRFCKAKLEGKIEGHHIPIGSHKREISSENVILAGDAAHLVDPLTGGGIGNAFFSGKIAADVIAECLNKNDFSKLQMRKYDNRIYRELHRGMRISFFIQKMLLYPRIVSPVVNWLSSNPNTVAILSKLQMRMVSGKST